MVYLKWKVKIIPALLSVAMVFMLWPGAAYAANPAISSSFVFDNNSGIRVEFSEGIYTGVDAEGKGIGAVTAADFDLTFNKNAGNADGVSITALKNGSGGELSGGESSIIIGFTTIGVPSGKETIEVKVKDGTSIYNGAGEAMGAGQSTGAQNLYDKFPPDFVTGYPKAGEVQATGSKQVEILVKAYESVTAYYVVAASGSGLPSAQQVKSGNNASGVPALASGQDILLTANEEKSIITDPLPADNTAYDIYMVIKDASNNIMLTPKKATVTTPAALLKVSSITVTGQDGVEMMKTHREGGSLQMLAAVMPADAANKEITWSVTGKGTSWLDVAVGEIGAGFAYIDPHTGLMNQGHTVGPVTVKATAKDGSGVVGEKDITITGVHMSSSMSTLVGRTHTMTATPVPALAAGQRLTWASSNEAAVTVDQDGNIIAVGLGSANITAATPDGRQGIASVTVDKSPANFITSFSFPQQTAPANIDGISVVNIGVSEETDISKLVATYTISEKASVTVNGAAQLSGVSVNDFTNPVVYKVTAENGDVRDWTVTVSKPHVAVDSITVTGAGGTSTVKKGKTLQMSAEVSPVYADNKTVTWSVINGAGTATVDASGLLTAVTAGTVTVKATANDGSAVVGSRVITIISSSSGNNGSGGSSTTAAGTAISSGGGTVSDKGVTVDIPAKACNATIRVVIARVGSPGLSLTGDLQLVSDVFDITKDRDEDFDRDVTITLPFDKNQVDKERDEVAIYWWNGSRWMALDNIQANWVAGSISGTVNHFTKFAVLAKYKVVAEPESKPEKPKTVPDKPQSVTALVNDIDGHWAEDEINNLLALGVVSGYPDGSFKPERTITRAEFAAVMVRGFRLPANQGKTFGDTVGHWGQDVISAAYAVGIVCGYNDTYFGPDDPITREQMAVMIVKAAQLSNASETQNFTDSQAIASWAREAVAVAYTRQLISGYPDNTFRPQNLATRAEAVSVITRSKQ